MIIFLVRFFYDVYIRDASWRTHRGKYCSFIVTIQGLEYAGIIAVIRIPPFGRNLLRCVS